MNDPMPPPVTLETLGELARIAPRRPARHRRAEATTHEVLTSLAGVAAGLLAGRLVPAVIAAADRRHKHRARKLGLAAGVGLAALTGVAALAGWQLQRVFLPKPKHEVERHCGRLEIRRYPSVRIAETTVLASWDDALKQGFERLVRFILGDNDSHARLRMAAPVIGAGNGKSYRLAFVMPDESNTPSPNDPRIEVSDVPPRRVAVLRFRGPRDARAIEARKRELVEELAKTGLKPHGEAFFAGYDPPSTLPFLRRNELWIELEDQVL